MCALLAQDSCYIHQDFAVSWASEVSRKNGDKWFSLYSEWAKSENWIRIAMLFAKENTITLLYWQLYSSYWGQRLPSLRVNMIYSWLLDFYSVNPNIFRRLLQSESSVCNLHRHGNSHTPWACTSVVGRSCWFIVRSRKQRYLKQSESEPIVWNTTFSFSDFTLAHLSFLLSPHLDLAQFKQQFHSHIIWLHFDKALSYQYMLHMLRMRLVFCFYKVCKVLRLKSVITSRMVWPCVCACVFAGDCEKVSDTWPLKQPRINGHNRSQWPY